jgi:hypothetical protein
MEPRGPLLAARKGIMLTVVVANIRVDAKSLLNLLFSKSAHCYCRAKRKERKETNIEHALCAH